MGLIWPAFLVLLIIVPFVVSAYILVLRRRRRFALHYSSLALIQEAIPTSFRWRRHLPFALFVLALMCLVFALSRPVTSVSIASSRTTIMLALDVSLSMCANDISPNRLTVAQQAAETFIRNQEPSTQIGIVAFAGFAHLTVPPTTDTDVLLEAVENLSTARATAIGSAIFRSLDALAEINPAVAPADHFVNPSEGPSNPERTFQPDIIVLLTDGANTQGVRPLAAAHAAMDRGVRVYTIGFGTSRESVLACTARQLGGDDLNNRIQRSGFGRFGGGLGGFGGFARRNPLALDEDTLQQVAEITDAEYYLAESADELLDVFENVPVHMVSTDVRMEVSAFLTAIGALLALAAVALGQRWSPLP